MRKKLFIGLVIVLVFVGGFLGVSNWYDKQIKTADEPTKLKLVKVVALGDSLTQGIGDTTDQGGYPSRVAAGLHKQLQIKVESQNFGKEGDRSDQIERRLKDSVVQQTALKKANIILMTVGGNDLIKTLQSQIVGHSAIEVNDVVDKSLPLYQQKLSHLLQVVRDYNPKAPIYLYGNYNPLYVYFPNFETINQSVKSYNQINQKIVQQYGGYYVPLFKRLTYGQYQDSKAQKALLVEANMNNVSFLTALNKTQVMNGEKNKFLSPSDHFHPNALGYDLMAKLMINSLLIHDQWQYKN